MTQQEELAALRLLVEKQKELLEEKQRIIDKQNIQIENMIQALLHARKKLFGPSTEVSVQTEGQMSLFESVQELAKDLGLEQKKITVRPYTRTARQPGVRAEMLAGLPQEVEEYIIPADETCRVCGGKLVTVGKKLVRTEVEFVPANSRWRNAVYAGRPKGRTRPAISRRPRSPPRRCPTPFPPRRWSPR